MVVLVRLQDSADKKGKMREGFVVCLYDGRISGLGLFVGVGGMKLSSNPALGFGHDDEID